MAPPAHGPRRRQDIAELVAGLEPAQRAAVLADDPVVCVLAGAGTGKTRVLTLRVARRVQDRSAHPTHVLVCTFSRKAADELRNRLWTLGVGAELQAGTFHRTALRLIAQHRADHGQAPPTLADRRSLIAAALDFRSAPETSWSARNGGARTSRAHRTPARLRADLARLEAEIGWAKARLIVPSEYEEEARGAGRRSSVPAARVAEHYAHYEEIRRQRGVFDLDDLLWHCGDLLEQDQKFADAVRWWHRHVFVDEMQDLNEAQYRLLRLLVGDEPDLFVVGDPNQSVYGWNGADPELLRRVTEEFAGTRVVRLDTNHRCSSQVVTAASAALGRDDPPPSARGDGPVPTVACLPTDAEEARWVARRVWLAHRPGRHWSSIAVLARTNAQLARIAQALTAERVPHRFAGAALTPASDVTDAGDAQRGAREGSAPDAKTAAAVTVDTDDAVALDEDADAVVLSTFHRAKGLQWRTVFVVGVSDGLVPLVTARAKAAKDEERRLFYVALTRAEDELACSWALHADHDAALGAPGERRPSPWLASVERALEEMLAGSQDAGPARAAEQLDRIRALLPPVPAGTSTGGTR